MAGPWEGGGCTHQSPSLVQTRGEGDTGAFEFKPGYQQHAETAKNQQNVFRYRVPKCPKIIKNSFQNHIKISCQNL